MLDPDLMAEIENIAALAAGEDGILEQLAHALGFECYEAPPVEGTPLWEIDTGLPAACHVCGATNKWHLEGKNWVCDDHPDLSHLPIRSVSHRSIYEVTTFDPAVA